MSPKHEKKARQHRHPGRGAQADRRRLGSWGRTLAVGVVVVLAASVFLMWGETDQPDPVNVPADESTFVIASETPFLPTIANATPPLVSLPEGMVWVPGGEFSMGAADLRARGPLPADTVADAQPIHRVYVDGFWMDQTEVTNAQFAAFVEATGYVTVAERTPSVEEFPGAPPDALVAGSIVFTPTATRVPLTDYLRWWRYQPEASWRHPDGPDSELTDRDQHPVVHVTYEDAEAYAQWMGRRLPTEAEFEFAARGGLVGQVYAWGSELHPHHGSMANIFQGVFPVEDTGQDGHVGTSPVGFYPPNGYDLYDLTGNVWEWVSDWYRPDYYRDLAATGQVARNPQGPVDSFDPAEPGVPKKVHRGGSFLCTDQYCARYMVGTRGKGDIRTSTDHLGFRTVLSDPSAKEVVSG